MSPKKYSQRKELVGYLCTRIGVEKKQHRWSSGLERWYQGMGRSIQLCFPPVTILDTSDSWLIAVATALNCVVYNVYPGGWMFTTFALLVFALRTALLLAIELRLTRLLLLFPWLLLLSPLIALFRPSPKDDIVLEWLKLKEGEVYPWSKPLGQEAPYWQCFSHLSAHFHQKEPHQAFLQHQSGPDGLGEPGEIAVEVQDGDPPALLKWCHPNIWMVLEKYCSPCLWICPREG